MTIKVFFTDRMGRRQLKNVTAETDAPKMIYRLRIDRYRTVDVEITKETE